MPPSDPSSPFRPESRIAAGAATLASAAALFALAACTTPPPAPPPPPPPPKPVVMEVHCAPPMEEQDSAARHFFATQDRLSTLNTADLAAEANHPPDTSTVQGQLDQALALSLTHVPGDTQKAQALVDQVTHNTSRDADPWRGPARMLATTLGEQRRLQDQADHAAQQLRDAQRDNQRKLDQVNEKLDQLKAIERSLNARPGSAAASKPGP